MKIFPTLLAIALPSHFAVWLCFVAGLILHSLKLSYDAIRHNAAKNYAEYFKKNSVPLLVRSVMGGVLFYFWSGHDTGMLQKIVALAGVNINSQLPVTAGTSILAGFFADSVVDFVSTKIPWLKNQIPTVTATIAAAVLMISATGCAAHKPNNARVTPYEHVLVINDQIAQVNRSVAIGITRVSPSLIPIQKAAPILIQQRNIAFVKERVTALLAKGPDYLKGNPAELQELIKQLQTSAQAMISNGSIGVKNPETQQTFDEDIRLIGDLANELLSELKNAGVLK